MWNCCSDASMGRSCQRRQPETDPQLVRMQSSRWKFPSCCLDRETTAPVGLELVIAQRARTYHAVRHLLDLGHRWIALVMGPTSVFPAREPGYREAHLERGVAIDKTTSSGPRFTASYAYEAVSGLLWQQESGRKAGRGWRNFDADWNSARRFDRETQNSRRYFHYWLWRLLIPGLPPDAAYDRHPLATRRHRGGRRAHGHRQDCRTTLTPRKLKFPTEMDPALVMRSTAVITAGPWRHQRSLRLDA